MDMTDKLMDKLASSTLEIRGLDCMSRTAAERAVSDHYHDRLTYKGMEFFDTIYMGAIVPAAKQALRSKEKQESYLGYLPGEDVFVSGWDVFSTGNRVGGRNVAFVKVDTEGNTRIVQGKGEYHGMMYMNVYNALHAEYPTLIDIRLD